MLHCFVVYCYNNNNNNNKNNNNNNKNNNNNNKSDWNTRQKAVKTGNLWSSAYFTETFQKFSAGKIDKKTKHFTDNDVGNILL